MTPRLTALLLASAASLAQAQPTIEACNGADATVLHGAAPQDARAVWLDRGHATWPGMSGGSFKLYHSTTAQVIAARGAAVAGADGALTLDVSTAPTAARFKYLADGVTLAVRPADAGKLPALHQQQLMLVQEDADGKVLNATLLQAAGALDDLYAGAAKLDDLGVHVAKTRTAMRLWAPTAQNVAVCTYDSGDGPARTITPMQRDAASGSWHASMAGDLSGSYYKYIVDVFAPSAGVVRNLVTDPYSISLTTDSKRSYIASLDAAALKPAGWSSTPVPATVKAQTDMTVYELHVRDFSINDATVPEAHRGKYLAFTDSGSNGMKHLAALAKAGMTDIHLLPVYDIGSVPEQGCTVPKPSGAPDSEAQQALVKQTAETDCFNWGYDPFHYNAPEGSYATDAADGARRIIEFRQMVQALHRSGLRVGMDVVYNHTFRAGQHEKSVLDRIVPGYYHRLNASGAIEQSTCCANTATENLMMGKLMDDTAVNWVRHYQIDSFRFDLMGHQPRAAMEQLQAQVDRATGRHINLIGEGWNFGEVANGARFVQASQLSLNGSGIGAFSDRARDAVRGGAASDSGETLVSARGFINGGANASNADMVRVGLAGSVRDYPLTTHTGQVRKLEAIDYGGQPAGYASAPGETVNYVENHDNQTLFDINVFRLPPDTPSAERARVQVLGAAINAFSQGVAYFHAGLDTLRSKSLDRDSFNSGDWFNRIDWSYQDNYFGIGLPPFDANGKDYALIKPLLANGAIKPTPADIAFTRDAFRDLLKIRASSTLFRLRTAGEIRQRLHFYDSGAQLIGAHLDGRGYAGAAFKGISYFINVDTVAHSVSLAEEKGKTYHLHPAHTSDKRVAAAKYERATGTFTIPPRSAVAFVE
ncbi:MAG: alpha-1,6-glucosidase domain-containing protein [Pseudomonadota bacterium]